MSYSSWSNRARNFKSASRFAFVRFSNYSRDCSLSHGLWFLFFKSSGLADFENTVDRGSAEIFDADFGLCLSYVRILGPKQNLHHRSFFSLGRNVNEFIQIISFFLKGIHLNSSVRLLLELYCVIVNKHVAFFTAGRN